MARLAPSAGNRQAYRVVIVREWSQRMALARAALHQMWIAHAPAVLVFLADGERSAQKYRERGRSLYAVQDATLAAAYAQLALEADGWSSCWVGAFREDAVASIVIDDFTSSTTLRPVAIMPVGIAAERPARSRRRPIRKFVHHGTIVGAGGGTTTTTTTAAGGSSDDAATRAKRKIDSAPE